MSSNMVRRRWLGSLTRAEAPSRRQRRAALKLTRLEDRTTPVSVANVLANNPALDPPTSNFTQSETSTIVFGNTILASFNSSRTNTLGNHFTGYGRSTDGGLTFTDMGALPGNNDAGDPVLARDNTTGTIYFTTLAFTSGASIQMFRSVDNGATFTGPTTAITGSSLDKEWLAVDNFPGTGQGNVYAVARDFGGVNGIVITRSTNGGATFSSPVLVVSGQQGAWVVVNPDHSLNVFWYDSSSGSRILTRKSTDFGATFGATVVVATRTATGTNGDMGLTRSVSNSQSFRSNGFPSVVVNPVDGTMYCVFADRGTGSDKADVYMVTSTNGGATWSAKVRVNTDSTTTDQWQPSIAITPDGTRLGIAWYDRRLDPTNNALIDYFGVTAALSGGTVTFNPNVRITTQAFLPDFGRDNVVNPVYMGDYDSGSATNSNFVFSWADNRLANPDVRVATLGTTLIGGEVIGSSPTGSVPSANSVDVNFNQPMDPLSFDVAADVVAFTRNGIDIRPSITGFSWLNSNTTLRINFSQPRAGLYSLTVGPQILTAGGVPKDDNLNGVNREAADAATVTFIIQSPRITSSTPTGSVAGPVSSVTVNFSQVMDTTSFSVAQDLFSFTGTPGNLLQYVTGFQWVTNQQLRIDFSAQSVPGSYSMVLNPSILSAAGDELDNNNNGIPGEIPGDRYSANFSIGAGGGGAPNAFGYRWGQTTFDPTLNIVFNGTTVLRLDGISNHDDASVALPMGSNTFNYYGTTYTGNQMFVSSNALISFLNAVTTFTNTDLSTSPTQAVIAPLWDDLHTGRNTATNDEVLYQFQDLDSNGVADQLVINWRNVRYFGGSSTSDNGITFQAVLQVNTGSTPGQMKFNWIDLDDGSGIGGSNGQNFGASATVGIKNAGATPAAGDPILIAFNGNNPSVVAQGQAVRIFRNSPPTTNANGPYTVAPGGSVTLSSAGTSDPDGDPLVLIWDLDGDGIFGETGAFAGRGDEVGASPTFLATGLVNGDSRQVALRAVDPSGSFTDATATVNVVGASAPTVQSVVIGNGLDSTQRSMVSQIVVTFDQVISYAGAPTSAYLVQRIVGGVPVGTVGINVSTQTVNNQSVATITFTSNLDGNSLADSRYRLTVVANQILVGSVPMAADSVTNFHRMFGDANGSATVDIQDFGLFSLAYFTSSGNPNYRAHFDKDSNGNIDIFDFGQFSLRYFTTLP